MRCTQSLCSWMARFQEIFPAKPSATSSTPSTTSRWHSGRAMQREIRIRCMFGPTLKIADARIHAVMNAENVDPGAAIMHAMFAGNPQADKILLDPVDMEQSLQL